MVKQFNIILIAMIFLMVIIPMASAQTSLGTFAQNLSVSLIQTCDNSTYSNITRILFPNSTFIINSQTNMTKAGDNYNYILGYNWTQDTGNYLVYGVCDENDAYTSWQYDFTITPNGEEATIGTAVFYIGIFLVLIFFFAICIYAFVNFDNLLARVAMIGLGYLLLMAVTFIGWNMAQDFLTSSPFLIEMMRILFWIMVVGFFPLIIGGFAWYVLLLFKIKEINNLMEHGMSVNDAEDRVGRRR